MPHQNIEQQPFFNGFQPPPNLNEGIADRGERWQKKPKDTKDTFKPLEIKEENSNWVKLNPNNQERRVIKVCLPEGKYKTTARTAREAVLNASNKNGLSRARIKEILEKNLFKVFEQGNQ
ncbi:hypothetical protein FJ208_01095 [Candidatus Gribaldobacteria bacterium]|nr:hypothetical protein [Candidatus Gribaldobacteria bacterium]